jgi:hypothetical protein
VLLLVPSDPLRPRRADPHLADEAAAARELGVDVALLDHDLLVDAHDLRAARAAVQRVPASDDTVYRGWMVTAARYALLEQALAERGARLRTTASQYRRGHELPGWHAALASFTPQACWTRGADLDAYARCLQTLGSGAAVLRDYTKSLKHHWHEAALVPDVTDDAGSRRVAARFLELRGDAFDGGLVLRRFEDLTGAESRTWWVAGRCVLATAHPDTPDEQPEVPHWFLAALAPAVASLGLPFVTADLVRRADGSWRVVEIGDGQVSDRPRSCPAPRLVHALVASSAGNNSG